MGSQYLTTGIKIKVDATDLETKFAKAADELNRTLTKSQKSLGLFYDEQKRLVNSQGQVVEGLTLAQIRLGYYVDELGRTRTYQGGFTEGLNASQKAMGWFSDELGNVYNRLGQLVIESKRATGGLDGLEKNTRELDEAFEKMASAADSALGSLGSLGGQTAQLFATIQAATGENDAFTSSIIAAGEGLSVFVDTYGATVGVMQFVNAAQAAVIAQTNAQATATRAATVAQKGLNAAMKANPVGLLVGGVSALIAAVATYKSTIQETSVALTGAFGEAEKRARRAGASINGAADIARFGFSAADSYASLSSEYDKLAAAKTEYQKIIDAGPSWFERSFSGVGAQGVQANAAINASKEDVYAANAGIRAANERQAEIQNQLIGVQNQMIATARDAVLTESQKLEAQKKQYLQLLENAKGTENQGVLEKYIVELTQKIAAAKEKELQESITEADYSLDYAALMERRERGEITLAQANAAYQGALERSAKALDWNALNDDVQAGRITLAQAQETYQGALERQSKALDGLGVTALIDSLKTAKTPLQQLDETTGELHAAFQNGVVSLEKYNEALAGLAQKRSELETLESQAAQREADAAKAELRSKYGVDDALSAMYAEIQAQKTPFELMNEAIAGYRVAMEKGGIDLKTFNDLANYERDKYLKATKDATDAAEQERRNKIESLRSESGVESLLDSLKSPWQKYLENLNKINGYVAEGAVTAAEAQLLADKALSDANAQSLSAKALNGQRPLGLNGLAEQIRKAQARTAGVETATAGSQELYRRQISQRAAQAEQIKIISEIQAKLFSLTQIQTQEISAMKRALEEMSANWPKVYGRGSRPF